MTTTPSPPHGAYPANSAARPSVKSQAPRPSRSSQRLSRPSCDSLPSTANGEYPRDRSHDSKPGAYAANGPTQLATTPSYPSMPPIASNTNPRSLGTTDDYVEPNLTQIPEFAAKACEAKARLQHNRPRDVLDDVAHDNADFDTRRTRPWPSSDPGRAKPAPTTTSFRLTPSTTAHRATAQTAHFQAVCVSSRRPPGSLQKSCTRGRRAASWFCS